MWLEAINPGKLQHTFFFLLTLDYTTRAVILGVQWKALGKLAVTKAIVELNELEKA